jgi:carbonic anhydrase
MTITDELLASAQQYAGTFDKGSCRCLPPRASPSPRAWMGPPKPVPPAATEGDVIRDAGGAVTDDVIRSLAISQRLLGTRDIVLIHHTNCGTPTFTDDGFKAKIVAETGIRPPWAAEAFGDPDADVR